MQDSSFTLGISLVKRNVIEYELLDKALKRKQEDHEGQQRNLAQILVSDFNIDHNSVYQQVAELYGFRKIAYDDKQISKAEIEFIQKLLAPVPKDIFELMKQERILPLQQTDQSSSKLVFVTTDPTNKQIPSIARALHTKRHEVCYISPADYLKLFQKVFPQENEFLKSIEDSNIVIDESDLDDSSEQEEEALDAEINQSLLVNLVEGMFVEAVRTGVSDIHIIPKDSRTTEILFRQDGRLRPWYVQEGVRPEALAAVVKDRSKNIDRFEREKAQDGFIQRKIDGHMIRYRVSVLPIVGQEYSHKLESIVIRILDDRNVIADLEKLGFQGNTKEAFIKAITKPQGMVILTGPTGSGKSTTLIAALSYILNPEINVLTVEDPVEYIIPGVRQLKIGPKNNFEQAVRSILRHDPDVVMVGEMRDKQTAEIAIKLANTGHLTFSTLHTNDAPSAISRLFKMGIETFLISNAINIVIAQRLILKLCEKCKRPVSNLNPKLPASLGFTEEEILNTVFYEAPGCKMCHKGYKGRLAIHEALFFSKEIKNLIFDAGVNINENAIKEQAIKDGMLTLRASARERVKQGLTNLKQVSAATTD